MILYPSLSAAAIARDVAGLKRRPEVDNVLIERLVQALGIFWIMPYIYVRRDIMENTGF